MYKLKEDLAWPLFLLFVERKENKQFQFCLKNQEVKVFCGFSMNIYERNLIVIRMMDEISIENPMPGPWLLQNSLVQFSLIRSFLKFLKYFLVPIPGLDFFIGICLGFLVFMPPM